LFEIFGRPLPLGFLAAGFFADNFTALRAGFLAAAFAFGLDFDFFLAIACFLHLVNPGLGRSERTRKSRASALTLFLASGFAPVARPGMTNLPISSSACFAD
jgi:hypothetical protein